MALTFDDGPSSWTGELLDVLAAHGAHATFFLIGEFVPEHAGVVRRALAEGHEIGSHTFTHTRPLTAATSHDDLVHELREAGRVIAGVAGFEPTLLKPPWLSLDDAGLAAAGDAGLTWTVMPTVAPWDWQPMPPAQIADEVVAGLEPGVVVGLHDGIPRNELDMPGRATPAATVAAVAQILDRASDMSFVTVSKLLAAP